MAPYSNQAEIDKINEKLKKVAPGLRLNSFLFDSESNEVHEASVTIPLKGSKEIIRKLVALGFKTKGKRMVSQYTGWGYSAPGHYVIDLCIPVPTAKEEAHV